MTILFTILLFMSFILAGTQTVAISYFDNTSGLEEYNPLSKGLADMLITDLSNVKSIQIVEREKLESLLKEIDLGESKFMDESTAQKLGKGLGAAYMLTGSYLIMGETMRIDARLVEVGTGEVSMGEEITGKKNTFFELEKDLVQKLIVALDLSLSKSEERRVKKVQTESFDSFNAYSTALDSYDNGKYEESQAYLEKAIEIDEDFEIAWNKLDEIEKYLEDMLLTRSLGLGEYYINLINSLNYDDPNSCNNFIAEMNGKIMLNQIHRGALMSDLYYHLKHGHSRTYKEHEWKLYGFTKMHINLEDFFIEYGKVKGEIIKFYDQLIFGNYPDRKCGNFNPKERCITNMLQEIYGLQLTYYQTGVAINKDGTEFFTLNHSPMDDPLWFNGGYESFLKVGDSATHYYNKQYIKYADLLYKKYPNTIFTHHLDFFKKAIELEK